MKGIFQLRPPTPRICSTWRVGPVLRYLSSLEPLEELSLKVLSLKLTTLLALTSAARAHVIAALDCNHVPKKIDGWEFIIPTHVKNSRPYHPPQKIYFGRYSVERSVCVVRCLEHYIIIVNVQANTDETSNSFCPIQSIQSGWKSNHIKMALYADTVGWSRCQLYRALYKSSFNF